MGHGECAAPQLAQSSWVPLRWAARHDPQHCRTGCPPPRSVAGNWALDLALSPWASLPVWLGARSADTPCSCLAAVVTLLSCTLPSSCHAVYRAKVEDAKIIMNPELVREEGFPVLSACCSPQNLLSQNYRTGQLLKCQVTSSWSSHSFP